MIFDDYTWNMDDHPASRPKIAIDAFLSVFENYTEYLHNDYQIVVRKIDWKIPKDAKSQSIP